MTDLETACRELLTQWRERGVEEPYGMTWHPPADELEHALEEHTEMDPDVKHLVEQMEDAT